MCGFTFVCVLVNWTNSVDVIIDKGTFIWETE